MGFLNDIKNKVLIHDGSKGFMLQKAGLPAGGSPEEFNLSHPDIVFDLHKKYVDAGCDVIQTNTFTGNRSLLEKHGLGDKVYEVNKLGAELASKASAGRAYVAASIGPTGELFQPFGTLTFDKAYDIFKEQAGAVIDGGADLINFETFTDISEMKAALLAVRENYDIPVVCSMAFEENKRTLMGTSPADCARILSAAGADLVGANCSFGPGHMLDIIREMAVTGNYLSVKPNAGLPHIVDGNTVYDQCPADFAGEMKEYFTFNVRLAGGCCGTSPEFMKELINVKRDTVYKGETDTREYLCSPAESIPVESIKEISTVTVSTGASAEDILDDIYDAAYSECDAVEFICNDSDPQLLRDVFASNLSVIKKPVIFSGTNKAGIENVLRIYPGIAGLRNMRAKEYGAVRLS